MRKDLNELKKLTKKALKPQGEPFDFDKLRTLVQLMQHEQGVAEFFKISNRHVQIICRYSAWKYCYVFHVVLRGGLNNALSYASNCRLPLADIRNYWARQSDEMANSITAYCKVLQKKFDFHKRFPYFNGNLRLLTETVQFDINVSFELTADICDFLELLLQLQAIIFASVSLQEIANESAQCKCRLQPLGNIAAECFRLYEYAKQCLGILFTALPADSVEGLYKRFCVLHVQLWNFYLELRQVSALINLQTVPNLQVEPPRFYNEMPARFYSGLTASERSTKYSTSLYPQLPEPSAPAEWELQS